MVKKLFLVLVLLLAFFFIKSFNNRSHANSYEEIVMGSPNEGAGYKIASKGGWKLIEFWHYSSGYWKATTDTGIGLKELIIYDNETINLKWTDPHFLKERIYEDNFMLEYKIWHPQEVIDAMALGSTITPIINIDTDTIDCTNEDMSISDFFNFESLPSGQYDNLPEKPDYLICDNFLLIRALPKLNCIQDQTIKDNLDFYFPYDIPLVKTSFGSLSYAMFHHDGVHTGVGYSPDPAYAGQGMNTIPYEYINDIQGRLKPGFLVTTKTQPTWVDEESNNLKIGDGTFASAGAVSIRFWYPIRIDYYATVIITPTPSPTPLPTPTPSPTPVPAVIPVVTENIATQNDSDMDAASTCIIRADERGNERFNVELGIPVRENLFINIQTKEYLVESTFSEHTHSDSTPIRAKKTYQLTWKEDHGKGVTNYCEPRTMHHIKGTWCTDSDGDGINDSCPGHQSRGCRDTDGDGVGDYCPGHSGWDPNWVDMSGTEVVYSEAHMVNRDYSYWTIDHFEAFVPDRAIVNNAALPGGKANFQASGISVPNITLSHVPESTDHVLNDPISEALSANAILYDTVAGCYVVDLGIESLFGTTSKPVIPAISNYDLLAENAIPSYKTKNDQLIFDGVTILNNDTSATGDTSDPQNIPQSSICGENAFYKNQLKIPDTTLNGTHQTNATITYRRLTDAINPVHNEVLTVPITAANSVTVHTPVVCNSGILDDYSNDQTLNPDRSRSALVLGRPSHIRFLTTGEHLAIPGYNTNGAMDCRKYTKDRQVRFPFDVYIGTDEPLNSCFVPKNTWYSISMSAACDEMDIFIPTWVKEGDYSVEFREIAANAPDMNHTETLANRNITNYIAVRSSPVRVIGRVYGFKITDITDTLWWDVFRVSKNSSEHTENYYHTGTKDEEGQDRGNPPLFTLPVLEGSHSIYKNRGALKTGYTFRFDLLTVGSCYGNDDYVNITPRFFYIKKDGTGRQEVDLWYHDEFNGKMNYFVKIEPAGRNRDNPKSMILGDIYRNVPEREITDTARIFGMNQDSFEKAEKSIGWYDRVILSQYQRTYTGPKTWLPTGVDVNTATQSVQKWYGEYCLPNDLFATATGFDVTEYGRTNNGLDGKESFWLKDGYIIVNFQIETVKDDDFTHPALSYWGAAYCNMFQREGFSYTKTDCNVVTFNLQDGDIVFYDTDKRSSDDYRTGGTH